MVSCDFLDVVPAEKASDKDAFSSPKAAERFLYRSLLSYVVQQFSFWNSWAGTLLFEKPSAGAEQAGVFTIMYVGRMVFMKVVLQQVDCIKKKSLLYCSYVYFGAEMDQNRRSKV